MESSIDTAAATDAVLKIQTAYTSLFTGSLIPAILAFVGLAIAIWLIFLAIKLFSRASYRVVSEDEIRRDYEEMNKPGYSGYYSGADPS